MVVWVLIIENLGIRTLSYEFQISVNSAGHLVEGNTVFHSEDWFNIFDFNGLKTFWYRAAATIYHKPLTASDCIIIGIATENKFVGAPVQFGFQVSQFLEYLK